MITLITGVPGTGKTALAVHMLLELGGARPVFQNGIVDLEIPHLPTPPVEQWTELRDNPDDPTLKEAYFTFPPDSVIVIDESQRIFRPRAVTAKVPDHVAAFETHRHTGVDFILLTQGPHLLDSNIRRLVGRHIHIRETVLGRYTYEWSECTDTESSARKSAVRKVYKLPKKVFSLYKSSELHTKKTRSIHPGLVALGLISLIVIGGSYYGYSSWRAKMAPPKTAPESATAVHAQRVQGADVGAVAPSVPPPRADYDPRVFVPRFPAAPESAPAYDAMRVVRSMPVVSACIASSARCLCWTQQATPVDVPENECRRFARFGTFNPYYDSPGARPPVESS